MNKVVAWMVCVLAAGVAGCGSTRSNIFHPSAISEHFPDRGSLSSVAALRPRDNPSVALAPTNGFVPSPAAPASAGGRRLALVIGNSGYRGLGSLANPANDAAAVAERLRRGGFELLRPVRAGQDVQSDLNLDEMKTAEAALKKAASGAEIAFLYYAGHGLQLDGQPFLVPTDLPSPDLQAMATASGKASMEKRLIKLDDFIDGLDNKAKVAVSVFDACREIPALNTRSAFGGGGVYRGLTRPSSEGKHRLLAFSAGFGQLAKDGEGRHSPYTQAFLDEFDSNPGQRIYDFFNSVIGRVKDATGQTPELLSQGFVPPVSLKAQ